jgi:hypothetical protein
MNPGIFRIGTGSGAAEVEKQLGGAEAGDGWGFAHGGDVGDLESGVEGENFGGGLEPFGVVHDRLHERYRSVYPTDVGVPRKAHEEHRRLEALPRRATARHDHRDDSPLWRRERGRRECQSRRSG